MSAIFALTLQALLPLFALIGLGYALRRWTILHHEHVPVLNALVLNVLLPATIVRALLRTPQLTLDVLKLPLALLLGEALVLVVVFGLVRLMLGRSAGDFHPLIGATLLTAAFGNTAFMGYPIVQTLLPDQFSAAVLIDEFGMMLALYPVAALAASLFGATQGAGRASVRIALQQFLRGPLFLSLLAGVLLRFLPLPAGLIDAEWAKPFLQLLDVCSLYLSQATTPVVLIALGVALEPRGGEAPSSLLLTACIGKLALLPGIVYGLTLLLGVHGEAQTAVVLQGAMPAGVLSAVLAQKYGMGGRFGVRSVCISTALAALTIPCVLLLITGARHKAPENGRLVAAKLTVRTVSPGRVVAHPDWRGYR